MEVNPWMILPFVVLLAAIAICPLASPHFWHQHHPKVAVGLGLLTVAYYYFTLQAGTRLVHVAHEYISFIVLIGSLFVVAGGIHIRVKGESTPLTNVLFLAIGAVLANVIGTTGAAMLLIRPWIRMNKFRITGFHTVFFIFIVANVGGSLTPIGDPPLFLGYLKGVPFWWVGQATWPAWLLAVGLLLAIFLVVDLFNFRKAPPDVARRLAADETWSFQGLHNILFIVVILAAVLANKHLPPLVPELVMIAAALASLRTTPGAVHEANAFSLAPVKEVAWLFLGIFATMMPALDYLGGHAEQLGIQTPLQMYWATGLLSAVLDNAPTYLTFLSAQMGLHDLDINSPSAVRANVESFPIEVLAISLGAVFFGAMTYIGNGPNLMVKTIAEHAKVRVPDFFGYLFFYAVPFLLPVLVIVGIVFFR